MLSALSPATDPGVNRSMRRRMLLIVLIVLLALTACKDRSPVIVTRFTAFGTQVDVSLVGVGKAQAKQATDRIEQDFAYLERDWHAWNPGPMTRVNRLLATGQPFVAPPSMLPLVRLSKTLAARSDGLFNPAIGYLMELWGFQDDRLGSRPPPSPDRIARLVKANPTMAQIDIDGLDLRGHNAALSLDFNAIAKSHAIDLSIRQLMETGIDNALIQAGGHLRAIGDRAGQPWRIPIRRPNGSGVFAILPIRGNESVATIAEYDRNFLFEGTLYHDVIDPRTGSPAQETRAVTVIHDDATTAAAAATALFIAGPKDWHRIAVNMGVRDVLLMDRQGRVRMNPAMAERIERVDDQDEIVLSAPLQMTAESSKTQLQ